MDVSGMQVPDSFYGDPLRGDIGDPRDTGSVPALIAAVYESISGPRDADRDWARQRSLFLPGARLIRTGLLPDGSVGARSMDLDEYQGLVRELLREQPFFESEVHAIMESWDGIAHVWSTYESRRDPADEHPFMRGINSFQLLHDGRRWWVAGMLWQHEGLVRIPAHYR